MRRTIPLTLVALMLLQTLALGMSAPASAVDARGGLKDDYYITQITIGNSTDPASVWTQSNGTTVDYLFEGDSVELKMEIQRDGNDFNTKSADAMIQIIHPIGYVMETFSWTSKGMVGGEKDSKTFVWTADTAHSILNTTTNDLSGGIIVRASLDKDSTGDDRNDNDVMEETAPVAIMKDVFDGTKYSQSSTFFPARYPIDGGDAEGVGSWTDLSGGAVGSKHWGNADGGNYPSNAHDRLVHAFVSTDPNGGCGSNAQRDAGMSFAYQTVICRNIFYASNYISSQIHIQAWGSVSTGDSVSIEMWRGSGGQSVTESIVYDITNSNPSQAPDQWTRLSWDPQVTYLATQNVTNQDIFLGGNAYTMGMVLRSDSSGATQGFHVDDWIQFGVRKVQEYTLDVDCNAPETGYSAPPSAILSLYCVVTNNGYSPATIRSDSNISNLTWMDPANPMIRQDAIYVDGAGNSITVPDHDTSILIPPIAGGASIELWVNLSIPAGADVQQLNWELWFSDASGQNSGEKARIQAPVGVTEQYGVSLTSTTSIQADSFGPGEFGLIPFRLQNSGNRDASFNLAATFSEDDWSALVVDENGVTVPSPVYVPRGQSINLHLNVTAATQANPGTVSFNLRATCPSCGALFGNDVLVRNIEVPIFRQVTLETDNTDITGPANGVEKKIYISIYNTGNDEEQYDLSLTQTMWQLGANLAASQTAVLEAWDGSSIIQLNLPMPLGLASQLYSVTVTATSIDDPSVSQSLTLTVDIIDTAAVRVSDEDADQSYIPGDPAQTMAFEVFNDGNSVDRFTMSFDLVPGMNAEYTNLFDGKTIEILPGQSYNVSVRFSFDADAQGQLPLGVIATSVNDPNISATGSAIYLVGSQNWLKIIPTGQLVINDAEPAEQWSMTVTVRNQYTTAQSVSMNLVAGESSNWIQSKISNGDRTFSLEVEEEREVTVLFTVSKTTLDNLAEDTLLTNLTLWAESQTVSDAASTTLQLQLIKTGAQADGDGAGSDSDSIDIGSILTWIGFIAVFVAGIVIIFRILTEEVEEDEYGGWGSEGYEGSVEATYNSVAAAPTVPVAGAAYAPPKAVPELSNVPVAMPPIAPVPAAPSPDLGTAETAPPVPAAGLPDGWTMEQWNVYGQMWLEQNGQA